CHDKRNENAPIDMLVCPHANLTQIAGLTPTCTQPGYKDYYECDDCHKLLYIKNNNYVEIDNLAVWKAEGGDGYLAPLGHDWGDPVYTWHLDVPNCIATSTCTRNDSHVKADVAENEHLQYVIDSQADCTHNEKGHYVATFTVEGFETQNSEQIEKANTALGHTNVIVYVWSQDKLKCSAYYECSVCGERELIEEVSSVYVKISDATCLKNEEGKRTATFTTAGLENQETPKYEIENTGGHIFGEPTYVWNNGSCTATRVCTVDETHIETETVAGVYQVVTAATCTANETGKYIATFTNPAFVVQESVVSEKANSALGHNYVFARIEWTSFTAKAFYTCANDESHVVSYDCTITSEITKAPTCLEKGVRTYTATYENHTDTKTEELAIGSHSLDYVAQVDATHDTEGHTAHYECSVCHKLYSDAEGNHEISRNSTIIPKLVRITVYGATILNSNGTLADVKAGDKVTIQANEPEEGKEFKGWALSEGGAIISTNSSIEITIGSDIQYYAVYADVEKPKTGLPTGALIGIIAGSVVLVASALVVVFVVLKKKKKAQE
nr:hypothetical protein [Gammaproteobacteria bacterium]